jgi:glycosyltransferase involved in cell wall biosynthesis
LSQVYCNIELLIVDDGSTDSSQDLIEKYRLADSRVRSFINSGPHGVSEARNIGLRAAKGRFITFLDSDDFLSPSSVKDRVLFALSIDAKIVYGAYERLLPSGKRQKSSPPSRLTYSDLLKKNYIGNLTGLFDANYFGCVQQSNIRHEDYLMWCRLIKSVGFAYCAPSDSLGVYRVSPNSLSGNKFKAAVWHWRVLRKGLQLSLLSSIYHQSAYVILSLHERISVK